MASRRVRLSGFGNPIVTRYEFDESLLEGKELVESYDFQGYSHERITREIWR